MNCIIVPVYKPFANLEPRERISLLQLYRILGTHKIFLVGPTGFDWKPYADQALSQKVVVEKREFEKRFFSGLEGYNELLISSLFYRAFRSFEYMLIYQSDAFVFRDDLLFWCAKGFDFIGSPWFEKFDFADKNASLMGVGNGGFSLRKISSFRRALRKLAILKRLGRAYRFFVKKSKFTTISADKIVFATTVDFQEDVFWTNYIPLITTKFVVAPVKDAIGFSFEVQPAVLYAKNDGELPFGCHAWWRYDLPFWKPFIEKFGYTV